MIPHERSLVQKFKGRPFALIGVNSDRSLFLYRKKRAEWQVTWRSFRDEGVAGKPAISEDWRISAWPSLFYLDHEGVIRHRDVSEPERMEALLEDLVAAAETAARTKNHEKKK
jgi:hypothetical protein